MIENQTQIPTTHYSIQSSYDTLERFISYFCQINLIKELGAKEILEIGIGNKTVSNYLKQAGFTVTTCDYDKTLQPDFVADIRELPMEGNSFDVVLACEILEHIPWKDVATALAELCRVTKKYAIVSIPYSSGSVEIVFASQLIPKIFKKPFLALFLRIPKFWHKHKFNGIEGSHYWEMGRRNYSIRKVRNALRERFDVVKESRPLLSSKLNHYFFVLEKRTVT